MKNNNNSYVNNQILVQFLNETPAAVRVEMRARFNATLEDTDTIGGVELWSFDSDARVTEALESLENNSKIGYVERNSVITSQSIPNDPKFNLQWGLHNTYNGRDIDAPQAWDITRGSRDVVIAVIDTGVDYNHPDLRNNIWVNPGEIANNGIDDDNNGYVDDYNGYDFLSEDANPMDGTSGHGTHVAGIIGAQANNSIGVSGVVPNIRIMPIRAVSGSTFDVLQAINYVNMMESRGVNIVATNNSYAFTSYNQGIRDAIAQSQQQGILYVASAGNSGANNDTSAATGINSNYPAVYNLDNIISVASTDSNDLKASSSNYGATTVDLGAPGVNIYSTTPNNTYGYKTGTSMAAPQVTGVVALLASQNPTWSYQQIRQRIFNTVTPVASLNRITTTGGRLNAYNALIGGENTPRISISNASITEGNTGYRWSNFTLSLDRPSNQNVSLVIESANGTATASSDYSAFTETLIFRPGQTQLTHRVKVFGDLTPEADETIRLVARNPVNATLANSQARVTIVNDDSIVSNSVEMIYPSSGELLDYLGTSSDTFDSTSVDIFNLTDPIISN